MDNAANVFLISMGWSVEWGLLGVGVAQPGGTDPLQKGVRLSPQPSHQPERCTCWTPDQDWGLSRAQEAFSVP